MVKHQEEEGQVFLHGPQQQCCHYPLVLLHVALEQGFLHLHVPLPYIHQFVLVLRHNNLQYVVDGGAG